MSLILALLACTPGSKADDPVLTDDSDPVIDTDAVGDTDPADDSTLPPHVPCDGPDGFEIGRQTWPTLQAALDASAPGDTILVCPGDWPTDATYLGDGPLTLQGHLPAPDAQVLRAEFDRPVLHVYGDAPTLTLSDLTLAGGGFWGHGGNLTVYGDPADPQGALRLERVVLRDSTRWTAGTALKAWALDTVDLVDVDVLDNHAMYGGAAVLIDQVRTRARLERCTLQGNSGLAQAGVNLSRVDNTDHDVTFEVIDSAFLDNVADAGAWGGALFIRSESPGHTRVRIEGSTFQGTRRGQSPDPGGGAVFIGNVHGVSHLTADLRDNTFDDNQGFAGAHLELSNTDLDHPLQVTVTDSAFWRAAPDPAVLNVATNAIAANPLHPHLENANGPVLLTLTDVDLGAGPTANEGLPFYGCDIPYEGIVSGFISPTDDDWCP